MVATMFLKAFGQGKCHKRNNLGVLSLMLGCFLLSSCVTLLNSETVDVGDTEFVYATLGQGPLTLVLESGLGDGMDSWESIFEEISLISKVFAYSRPGYGKSESTSRPRNKQQIVRDLRELLRNSGQHPPYVLVGHSLGGDYMLHYAEAYPQEVAGVVLVEARHPDFSRLCMEKGLSGCEVPTVIYSLWSEHVKHEYDAAQQMKLSGSIGNIPLVVISRSPDSGGMESDDFISLWMDTQKTLTNFSTNSVHIVAKNAGHYVHKDEPSTVTKGVRWVQAQSK